MQGAKKNMDTSKRTRMIHYLIRFVAIAGSLAVALYFLAAATSSIAKGDDGTFVSSNVNCSNGSCQFKSNNSVSKTTVRSSDCGSCLPKQYVRGIRNGAKRFLAYRIRGIRRGFGVIFARRR